MATKSGNKKKAPLRKAKRWSGALGGVIRRNLLLVVAVVVLGLMFSGLQGAAGRYVSIAITVAIGAGMLLFFYNEGVVTGATDAGMSRQVAKLEKEGKAIGAREDAACYHPLKALCGTLIVFAVPLAIAAYVALTSQAYTYSLQDLPTWLSSAYASREDILAPLGAYQQANALAVADWLRVVARLFAMIFINLFEDPLRMGQLIDRCVPAFIALYPLAFMIGYLRGPAADAKLQAQNKKAKKVAVRKQKRAKVADELLGQNQVPHYGQQQPTEKKRKKELI